MSSLPFASLILAATLLCLPGCAGTQNPHFFPRMHPLFAGLDQTKVGGGAKAMLANAKADFELARHGQEPRHAKYVRTIPYTHSRVFEARGYRLTMVKKDLLPSHYEGPQIILNSNITGGKPFSYDEVDVSGD